MASAQDTLARAIIKASQLREESYDHSAARQATEEAIDNGYGIVDYSQFYKLTHYDAAEKASKALALPVSLLLADNWNDAIAWAKGIEIDKKGM